MARLLVDGAEQDLQKRKLKKESLYSPQKDWEKFRQPTGREEDSVTPMQTSLTVLFG